MTREGFGIIIVDKPVGPTSHNVVHAVRQGSGVRKVGHAGTLDPRASGVLVLCLGAATRLSEYLSAGTKCYQAVVRFGSSTDTYDADGEVVRSTGQAPDLEAIKAVLPEFTGEIDQVPPVYSAIKLQGKKAYQLARAGKDVDLAPRQVTIYSLDPVDYAAPDLTLDVSCSAGTYVRSLANDLGDRLSTGAHLAALRRTEAGPFSLAQAVTLDQLQAAFDDGSWTDHVLPAAEALPDVPLVEVDSDEVELVRHGRQLPAERPVDGLARAVDQDGNLVAILEGDPLEATWRPKKVFIR
jgi:tRNA pseudouridine55 synthase